MMPCSSGNSPTISVTRSALRKCAARSACSASAPGPAAISRPARAPRDALVLRAELFVEGDLLELRPQRVERALAVLVPEELGVGEPRAQHAFVAGYDLACRRPRDHVGDHDEAVGELARFRIAQREVFLVVRMEVSGLPPARP